METKKEDIREYLYRQRSVCTKALSEREIAKQFAIKHHHARELLLELVGEGVVERLPRSGYRYASHFPPSHPLGRHRGQCWAPHVI